jgi:hypothetical protein
MRPKTGGRRWRLFPAGAEIPFLLKKGDAPGNPNRPAGKIIISPLFDQKTKSIQGKGNSMETRYNQAVEAAARRENELNRLRRRHCWMKYSG